MPLNPITIQEFEKTRIRHKAPAYKKMTEYKKRDDITKTVFAMSPDEVDAWLFENVKTIADMRMVMKRIIVLIRS